MSSSAASEFSPAQLLTPAAFPDPVTHLELRETNISWIVLTGLFAYKIKKSVRLDFLDASTLALRHHLCEEELRLNRRVAADLYLDVIAITREAGALHVGGQGETAQGEIIEYAVRMKQFDASQELAALLEGDQVSIEDITQLAEDLVRFHASADRASTGDSQHTEQLRDAILANLRILVSNLDAGTMPAQMAHLPDWTRNHLEAFLPELRMREQRGFVRECHGDLHAGNIVRWGGRLVPFDCLEFDPKLRRIDVMNDVAFLFMDLAARGREDLAWSFLNSYLERSGDYAGVRFLFFYAVYRALVRAMVDSLGMRRDSEHSERFRERMLARIKIADNFSSRASPVLFMMHGLSGSGKSWLSERLAMQLGAVRVRSDVERKRLPGDTGRYAPEFTHRTYALLLECADDCLKGGVNCILDATFLEGEDRRSFRDLAVRHGVQWLIISCEANQLVLEQRIAQRRERHADPSEADLEVLAHQSRTSEPLDASEREQVLRIDTARQDALRIAVAMIENRLPSVRPS